MAYTPSTTASLQNSSTFLSKLALRYSQSKDVFVADKIFPPIPVDREAGKFNVYGTEYYRMESEDIKEFTVNTSGKAKDVDFTVTEDSYNLNILRLRTTVDLHKARMASKTRDIDLKADSVEGLHDKFALKKERRMFTFISGTARYTASCTSALASSYQWDHANNQSPNDSTWVPANQPGAAVITKQTLVTKLGGGRRPNVAWCTPDVFNVLMYHPRVINRLNQNLNQTPDEVRGILAALFNVKEFYVVDAVRDKAVEGDDDSDMDFLGTKMFGLIYKPEGVGEKAKGMRRPRFGGQLALDGYPNYAEWKENSHMGNPIIEGREFYGFVSMSDTLGYLFRDVIS